MHLYPHFSLHSPQIPPDIDSFPWYCNHVRKITSFVLCLLAAELPVLTETRPSSRAAKERSRETDRNFGLCRGSEGHSELELYKSASRTVWRICRRVDLADFGVLGRGRADADIPAIDSNLSATSSAPDVLKQHQINLDSFFHKKNVCLKKKLIIRVKLSSKY